MSLSPEMRDQLLEKTRESAVVFLDDIKYIREVVAKDDTDSGEIRRLSGTIRRLLVHREIAKIATPRIGRLLLLAPDNKPYYKSVKKNHIVFFLSGRVNVFGWNGTICATELPAETPDNELMQAVMPEDFDLNRTVELRLENFLTQHVLYYQGEWVSREAVIKYVANVASGVHTTTAKTEEEKLLAKIRSGNYLSIEEAGVHIELMKHGSDSDETEFKHTPNAVDPVLIELLAASHFLSISPDIKKLETIITASETS